MMAASIFDSVGLIEVEDFEGGDDLGWMGLAAKHAAGLMAPTSSSPAAAAGLMAPASSSPAAAAAEPEPDPDDI